MINLTKTPILPNCQVPNGYFCLSLQVVYNCSAFVSIYFCCSFSRERKSERIERKFQTENPNLSVSLFHLLRDEESLMLEFFPDLANIGSAAQDYFDSICVIFYDHLRPKIVKLHHLETLSEISSILKVELMEHTSVSSNTGKNIRLKSSEIMPPLP